MSHSGVGVGAMSHEHERYESERSKCVGAMSHKCERYESGWGKCGKKRKESMNCNKLNLGS